jgi:hypothetical protein
LNAFPTSIKDGEDASISWIGVVPQKGDLISVACGSQNDQSDVFCPF